MTGTLPLSKSKKVALIGPNSNATKTMQGNYNVNYLKCADSHTLSRTLDLAI